MGIIEYALGRMQRDENEEQAIREAAAERLAALSQSAVQNRLANAARQASASGLSGSDAGLMAGRSVAAPKASAWQAPSLGLRGTAARTSVVEEAANQLAQAALRRAGGTQRQTQLPGILPMGAGTSTQGGSRTSSSGHSFGQAADADPWDVAEQRVDARETYEQTAARVGTSGALAERQRMVNEELEKITAENNGKERREAETQADQGSSGHSFGQAEAEPAKPAEATEEQKTWAREQAEKELFEKYGYRDFKDLSMEEQDRYLEDEDRLWDRQQEILTELQTGQRTQAGSGTNTPAAAQKREELTKEYNALKDADEIGSTYSATDEQMDEAERRVDARETYEETVARVGISAAIGERQRMINEELAAMTRESRQKREEEILAADPEAGKTYETAHNAERLEQVFNPFDNRQELLMDLVTAQNYGKQQSPWGQITAPGLSRAVGLERQDRSADMEYNGGLAKRAAASIQRRLDYQDDPEKALATVQADLTELRRLKKEGAYDKDRLQTWIWQQERQEKILQGYIASKDKAAADRGKEKYLGSLGGAEKEYAAKFGIAGGKGFWEYGEDGQADLAVDYGMAQRGVGVAKPLQQVDGSVKAMMAMSEAERAGFYALYDRDPEQARAYLEGMANVTGERWSQLDESVRNYQAQTKPGVWSALEEAEGMLSEVAKPVASVGVMLQNATGREVERYGLLEDISTRSDKNAERLQTTISTQMQAKGYTPDQIGLATGAYKVLHNTLSNVARNTTMGAMGLPSWVSTAVMALGTIGGQYYSMTDYAPGTTQAQRMAAAYGDAVSEFMTEALSDAHFFSALKGGAVTPGASWWRKAGEATLHVIAGSGIESGTEVLNDVVTKEWEDFVLKEESAANQRLDAYYRQALAELFPNNPAWAMEWAQQQAYKESMASLWETAYTSFISGGLMDVGGQVMNRVMTAGQRREQRQQDKRTNNFQFQEGSKGQAGATSQEAGTFDTVDAAVEAIQSGEYAAASTFSTQADAEQAAAEYQPTIWEGQAAATRAEESAAAAELTETAMPAAETVREAEEEAVPAWTEGSQAQAAVQERTEEDTPAEEKTGREILEDAARNVVENVLREAAGEPEGAGTQGAQPREAQTRPAAERTTEDRTIVDSGTGQAAQQSQTQADQRGNFAAQTGNEGIYGVKDGAIQGHRAIFTGYYKIDGKEYRGYSALDDADVGRFFVPQSENVNELKWRQIEKGKRGVIAEGTGTVDAEELHYMRRGETITLGRAMPTQATKVQEPAAAAEAPADATEIRQLPNGQVISTETGTEAPAAVETAPRPAQTRPAAERVTEDRTIVDSREGPVVRQDAPDRETAEEAAHIIPSIDTADAVAKAMTDIKAKPADDADGHGDIQAAGYAYEAAQRGIPLEQLGGVYVLNDGRKAMVAAAYERGQMDLEARTREIMRQNAAVAEKSGFRDGAKYRQHTDGVQLEGVTRDLTGTEQIQLGVLESMGKKYGIDFRVYDSLRGKNALYRTDSGQVDVSLEAKGGLVRAASHELYHYVEQYSPADAEKLKGLVLGALEEKAGYSLVTRIQEVEDAYRNAGEVGFDAVREIVADSMLDVLADDNAKITGAWYGSDRDEGTFWKRTADHIKSVGTFLRMKIKEVINQSPETKALMDDAEYVESVGDALGKAVINATAARQAARYGFADLSGVAKEVAQKYAERLERGITTSTAQDAMHAEIVPLLDKDGRILNLDRMKLRQLLDGALLEFTRGEKSMQKALEDEGFKAPDENTLHLAVYAAREMERAHSPEAVQAGEYKASITFDDGFEAMTRAQENFGDMDEGAEAAGILQKIFDILKRGKVYKTQEESLKPGQWAPDLKGLVDSIVAETGTKTNPDKLLREMRAMYTALDEALLGGQDFDVRAAVAYAKRIAEGVAEKAGTRIDTDDDMLTDLARRLKGRTVYLSPAQAEEAKRIYGNIRNLNRQYYGTVSFTTDGKRAGTISLEDMAREDGVLFGEDTQEADLFNRLEELIDQYKGSKQQAVDYNGMDRREFERDLTMRLVAGYFDLEGGLDQQTGEHTKAKTKAEEKYVAAVKEMRKVYLQRMRALETDYQRKTQEAAELTDRQIEKEKAAFAEERRRITKAYGDNALRIAETLGIELDAETRARLVAGIDFEEAHEAFIDMRKRMEQAIERRSEERAQKLFDDVSKGAFKAALGIEMRRKADMVRDREARRALRKSIEKTVGKFEQQLTQPNDKSHAPEEMRGAFAKVLGLVDTSNPRYPEGYRTQHWKGIQNYLAVSGLLDQYNDDVGVDWDPNLKENLKILATKAAGKSIMEMDTDELRTLSETLTAIKHSFDHYDEMLTEGAKTRVSQVAQPINDLALQQQAAGKAQQARTGIQRTIWQQLQGSLLDPVRWRSWADRMTGETGFGTKVHGMLRDAQDQQIRLVQQAEGMFTEWLTGVTRKQLETMHGDKAQTVVVREGTTDGLRITRGQLMSLYLLMQRKQAVGHILGTEIKDEAGTVIGRAGGGISVRTQKTADGQIGTTMPVQVTETEINAALDQLTPEEKRIADGVRKIMDWCSMLGNEVSVKMYGYKKFGETNYFPIKTDSHYTSQTQTEDNSNPMYILKNQGFTKALTLNANAPLQLQDIFDVVRDHTVGMINYNAWVMPVQDVTRVLNYKMKEENERDGVKVRETKMTTAQALDILMGENGSSYLKQLLKDINGISKDEIEAKMIFQNGLGKFKAGAVAYNLSTAAKQPWSITRAWGVVDPKYFAGGRPNGCRETVKDLLEKYAPIYTWKQYGNFVLDMGKSMDQIFYPQLQDTIAGKINDKSMFLPGKADNFTWGQIWRACERETADQHKDLTPGTETFYKQVANSFRECIDQTQVVDGIMQRTQVMRGKTRWIKMATSFMGEPMKSFNCLADSLEAIGQTQKGTEAHKKAMQYAARAAVVYGTSSMTMAVVSSFVQTFRHLSPDEPWGDTFMRYLTGFANWDEFVSTKDTDKIKGILGGNLVSEFSFLNKLPYLRDVFNKMQGYDAERSDVTVIGDLIGSMDTLINALQGGGKKGLGKAIQEFMGLVSSAFGVPVGNLFKEKIYWSNALALGINKITGADTFEWQYKTMKYTLNIDYAANVNQYVGLLFRTMQAGKDETAQKIRADLIRNGIPDYKIDDRLAKLYKADAAPQAREYMELMEKGKREEAEKIRTGFGGGKETFDSAVQEEIKASYDVAEANASRKAGDLKPIQDLVAKYRREGYEDALIYKAINSQYNSTQPDDEKVTASAGSMWLAKDLGEAVDRGDLEDAKFIVTWMQTEEGKAKGTVKSALTKQAKQKYIDAVEAGDVLEAERIKKMLFDVGLGYTEKEINGWTKK